MSFDQKIFDAFKKELTDVVKKIANYESRRQLPTEAEERQQRITQYRDEVVTAFNDLVSYADTFYTIFDLPS